MMPAHPTIVVAESAEQIRHGYPVMRELRPHIATEEEFLTRVERQQKQGYLLAYVEAGDEIRAVAGYRYVDFLFQGHFMYVDDLVTRSIDRSAGFGGQLFDWLVQQARVQNCTSLELDSGVQRFDAHRFYLMKRMKIASHHFSLPLS
ncbi:MAG TPA: GNAT family N-acetyltransferase [Chthoniobacterales bacterium]|nr:GNAT family N-acetyltransferase [Chthoniobacterales bacterium]